MLYDYLITFEQERKTIWQRKFSGATLLFLLNRYLALLYGALSVTTDGVKVSDFLLPVWHSSLTSHVSVVRTCHLDTMFLRPLNAAYRYQSQLYGCHQALRGC